MSSWPLTICTAEVHRSSCRQARDPLRGPGADPPGRSANAWGHRRRRGPYRRLRLRHDHGSNYLADPIFSQEVAFFRIQSSPSFVREPEGNGVAERFIRTLKELICRRVRSRDHRGTPPGLARVQADIQRTVDAGEIRLSKPRPVRRDLVGLARQRRSDIPSETTSKNRVGQYMALFRPDGVVIGVCFALLGLWPAGRRRLGRYLAVLFLSGVGGLVYFAWRYAYFGLSLPLPLYVKSRPAALSLGGLFAQLPGLEGTLAWLESRASPLPTLALVVALAIALRVVEECTASGFLDSGLTVFASTPPRPTRGGRVAPGPGFGSRTSPASTARCTSA